MGAPQQGGDDELITAINVTPLVDVVLVLLIILMVTATAIVSKTIPMELPEAATGENTPQVKTFAVSLDDKGKLYIDAKPVDSTEAVFQHASAAYAQNNDVRAVISAHGNISHSKVIEIIDTLRRAKVTKFAINVKPSELK